jgi:hypothetical protein
MQYDTNNTNNTLFDTFDAIHDPRQTLAHLEVRRLNDF